MDADDWELEMNRMLVSFANQAVFSLGKINRRFKALGRPFDEKFRQYFLKMSHQRLDMSYDTVLFANETENRTNIAPSTEDNAQHVKTVEKESTIESKTEKLDDGTLIEIYDSDDGEYSGMRAAIDLTDDKTEMIKSNVSLVQAIPNQNDDQRCDLISGGEVKLKDKENTVNEFEPVDIPLVKFNSNQESGSTDAVNKKGGSNTQQKNASSCMATNKSNGICGMRFKCNHCQHSVQFKSQLKKHHRLHSNGKLIGLKADSNGLYHCTQCVRRFPDVRYLSQHMKTHKDDQYLYYCSRCLGPFDQEAEKDTHENQCEGHHYECHLCKVFVAPIRSQILRHMRKHTGAKPFRCMVCEKSFTTKFGLRQHFTNIHRICP